MATHFLIFIFLSVFGPFCQSAVTHGLRELMQHPDCWICVKRLYLENQTYKMTCCQHIQWFFFTSVLFLKKLNKTPNTCLNPPQTPAIVYLLCAEPPLSLITRELSLLKQWVWGRGGQKVILAFPCKWLAVFSNYARMLGPSVFKDSAE